LAIISSGTFELPQKIILAPSIMVFEESIRCIFSVFVFIKTEATYWYSLFKKCVIMLLLRTSDNYEVDETSK